MIAKTTTPAPTPVPVLSMSAADRTDHGRDQEPLQHEARRRAQRGMTGEEHVLARTQFHVATLTQLQAVRDHAAGAVVALGDDGQHGRRREP